MPSRESEARPRSTDHLSAEDRAALHELARGALVAHLLGTRSPPFALTPRLRENGAAFVTLRSADGELRGCIGTTRFERPLGEVVPELAVAAACEDTRFEPVAATELETLGISLSVLTPLEPARLDAIEIGRHGLVVRRGGRSGLLLPQVASERGWDAKTFLEETSRKAGLPLDAWKAKDATVLWFTAESF
jgi:AmmeMemoRadiSam system protein A